MKITRAQPDATDWSAVQDLLAQSFAYMTSRLGHPARAAQASAKDLAAEAATGPVFVAHVSGALAGCLFSRASRDIDGALYIGKLAVAAHYRGAGIARALVATAEQEAREAGCTALTLDTGVGFPELHQAFQRLGFSAPFPRTGEPGVVTMIRAFRPDRDP